MLMVAKGFTIRRPGPQRQPSDVLPQRTPSIFIALGLIVATAMIANIACTPTQGRSATPPSAPLTLKLGGDTTRPLATSEAFTFIAANANDAAREAFPQGNAVFITSWTPTGAGAADVDGLGPIFNRTACTNCHANNGRGKAPANADREPQSMVVRISLPGQDTAHGAPIAVPGYGHQLQDRAIGNVPVEAKIRIRWEEVTGQFADGETYQLRKPHLELSELGFGPLPANTLFSTRVANPIIGLGLLELIPAETLRQMADPDDRNGDGISGRINMVFNPRDGGLAEGRFGWKANSPNLASQNAAAAHDDMGITSHLFPTENCQPGQQACAAAATEQGHEMSAEALSLLTTYTRWLAVPQQRGPNRDSVRAGFEQFMKLGCSGCHAPTLVTGNDPEAPELSQQVIHPFTDLLLHDMGEGLADGRPDFLASGREWRTPPLWGIGLTAKVSDHTEFLHDGRARSLQEAILWHGGEALAAREKFAASDAQQRSELLAFLNSL